jgi:hypothetical protein
MIPHQHRSLAWSALGGYAIALLAGLLVLAMVHAYSAGFSGADEPAHFLNGYFVSSYLHAHAGANPMAYAVEYYLHYPKISIGHWPPAYYGLLGVLFLALPASPEMAFLINLAIAALPAAMIALALASLAGPRTAIIGSVLYALTPLAVESQAFFMLDQALTTCCMAAAIAWLGYARRPDWPRALLFAALCIFAVLIKGNGWLIVLMPMFYMLLTRSWRLLAKPHLYVAAGAAAMVIVPWYWFTASISSDGFNYQAGLPYATRALGANLHTLLSNLGYVAMPLAAAGALVEYRRRRETPARWSIVSAGLGLILATLALQSIVPADIDARYLAPALPAYAALAMLGVFHLCMAAGRGAALPLGAVLTLTMLAPGAAHLAERVPKVNMRAADIQAAGQLSRPTIWIIDGSSGAEGALIAHLAVQDPALRHYAVRASKLLAASDFMGARYELKYQDPRPVLDELLRLGAQYVVLVRLDNVAPFPHSAQLSAALQLPDAPFRRVATLAHRNRPGVTEVYAFSGTANANIDAVRQLGVPAKSGRLVHLTAK